MGRAEATIAPDGAMGFTVYNGLGQVSDQWAGTTTATSYSARLSVISAFRTSGDDSPSPSGLTYTASGVSLFATSSDVYTADGEVYATTAYVDGNSAHNRVYSFGYDWLDEPTYAVEPANAQGNVTYTMTTYDNLGEAVKTQQYSYTGSESGGIPTSLASSTAEPPGLLNSSDVLLSQNTAAYDALGQTYQTASYIVTGGSPGTAQTTNYWFDPAGNQVAVADPDNNATVATYNGLGEETQNTQGQVQSTSGPWTFGNLALAGGQARTLQVYVYFASAPSGNWQNYSVSDSGGTPTFTASGVTASVGGWYCLGSVTLAGSDNSTSVTLTQNAGTVPSEICLGYSDQFSYYGNTQIGAGQLYEQIDRDGRATTYQYNTIGQETGENWYATSTLQNPTQTISIGYNSAAWLQSASDQVSGGNPATDSYGYDMAGEVTSDSQTVPGLTPTVALSETYTNGDRTQVAAAIGGTNDFVDNYTYAGPVAQMSEVTQSSNGGNTVAPKAGTFNYDYLGEFTTVNRYNTAGTSQLVAQASYGYDNVGNLTSLVYSLSGSTLPSYSWTYDQLGNMATASETLGAIVNSVSYSNDSTGQLTNATGTGGPPTESFSYDANGNRTNSGYATGPNNELLCDGTYHYQYDAEGNRVARWVQSPGNAGKTAPASGDTYITLYTWDNRDRLTSVTQYATYGGSATQTVAYIYDALNRCVGETITAGGTTTQSRYTYDGNQIVLEFDGTGTSSLSAGSLGHRYLWGPAVDQLLADEQVNNNDLVAWALGDSENTVRDLATYNSGTGATTVVNHRVFSAYGGINSQTNPSVGCLFAFTGRALDQATGLQNNGNRWYDAITGRWLSEDPIGFGGGDANLYRYCGNAPANLVDPSGLAGTSAGPAPAPAAEPANAPDEAADGPTYDATFWNDPKIKNSNNCYSYALDVPYAQNGKLRKPPCRLQPGGAGGKAVGGKYGPNGELLNKAALRDPFGVKELPADGVVPPGYHKIQAFFDQNGDYHWYRQDADGSWSHKPGHGDATNVDSIGNVITDPADAARNYGRGRNYSTPCPPLIAPNRQPSDASGQ